MKMIHEQKSSSELSLSCSSLQIAIHLGDPLILSQLEMVTKEFISIPFQLEAIFLISMIWQKPKDLEHIRAYYSKVRK